MTIYRVCRVHVQTSIEINRAGILPFCDQLVSEGSQDPILNISVVAQWGALLQLSYCYISTFLKKYDSNFPPVLAQATSSTNDAVWKALYRVIDDVDSKHSSADLFVRYQIAVIILVPNNVTKQSGEFTKKCYIHWAVWAVWAHSDRTLAWLMSKMPICQKSPFVPEKSGCGMPDAHHTQHHDGRQHVSE